MLEILSIEQLVHSAEAAGRPISSLVLEQQAAELELSEQVVFDRMAERFAVMRQSIDSGMSPDLRSMSGLSGGDAYRVAEKNRAGKTLCGAVFGGALAKALAVAEYNACMGRIVAAPTAGSCGILPAALFSMTEHHGISEHDAVMGMFTAAAIGIVIAQNASISGAEGGCQAECGSAAAMAAGALAELAGGTPQMVADACAIALKNMLGLVCDPVAGLVEIPCIKRNVSGIANAFAAAELALAGVRSVIPADEVILAMKRVGDSMPEALRETASGGLAATPTAREICARIF